MKRTQLSHEMTRPIGQHMVSHVNNGRVVHGKGFFDSAGSFLAQRAQSAAKGALKGAVEGAISGNGKMINHPIYGRGFFDTVGNFVAQRAQSAAKGALKGAVEGAISGNGKRKRKRKAKK
jgi:hypothetical protein